jgi:hypothetical protein
LRHEAALGVPAADTLAAHITEGFRRAELPRAGTLAA